MEKEKHETVSWFSSRIMMWGKKPPSLWSSKTGIGTNYLWLFAKMNSSFATEISRYVATGPFITSTVVTLNFMNLTWLRSPLDILYLWQCYGDSFVPFVSDPEFDYKRINTWPVGKSFKQTTVPVVLQQHTQTFVNVMSNSTSIGTYSNLCNFEISTLQQNRCSISNSSHVVRSIARVRPLF